MYRWLCGILLSGRNSIRRRKRRVDASVVGAILAVSAAVIALVCLPIWCIILLIAQIVIVVLCVL